MKVSGLDTEGLLRRVELHRREGEHTVCRVDYLLPGVEAENHRCMAEKLWRQIGNQAAVEDERRVYFRGVIKEVSGRVEFSRFILSVTLVSFSCEADREVRKRIYQDTEKTLRTLAEAVRPEGSSVCITDQTLAGRRIPGAVAQAEETDFHFLRRLAHAVGQPLFVDDTSLRSTLYVGPVSDKSRREVLQREDILTLSFSSTARDAQIDVSTRVCLAPGTWLSVGDGAYLVASSRMVYEDGETTFYHTLRSLEHWQEGETAVEAGFLFAGPAKVTEQNDPEHMGRLQVEFLDWEDRLPGRRSWASYLPLLTEGGGGVLALPDAGETVEVLIDRGACLAVGCLRRTPLDRPLQDPQIRGSLLRGMSLRLERAKLELAAMDFRAVLDQSGLGASVEDAQLSLQKQRAGLAHGGSGLAIEHHSAVLKSEQNMAVQAKKIDQEGSSEVTLRTPKLDIVNN